MIIFEKIRYKNFLSTGNEFTEVNLSDFRSTLIVGENGSGKCLRKSTEIEILNDKDFVKFIKERKVIVTLGDIEEFYKNYPEHKGKIKVKTRFGYYSIQEASITAFNSEVYRLEAGNYVIEGSPDHQVMTDSEQWVKLKDLDQNQMILTKNGYKPAKIIKTDIVEDLYDIQVEDVNEYYSNGIVSHNSTLIEAISYSLFGKPYRNINKGQLVNSINRKDMRVEIEFSVGKNFFKVIRGISHNIFEIYQNNELINQDSVSRDYQKHLETNILKLNHKSFHQVVVLGSSSFVPFMELPVSIRRQVIEDLLDIQIFSKMNLVVKETLSRLKDQIKDIDLSIKIVEEKIKIQKKYIITITEMNNEYINQRNDLIKKYQSEIDNLRLVNERDQSWIDTQLKLDQVLFKIKSLTEQKNEFIAYDKLFNNQIKKIVKDARFYEENEHCPTCTQIITNELKNEKIDEFKEKAKELNNNIIVGNNNIKEISNKLNDLIKISEEINIKNFGISSNNKEISRLQSQIIDLEKEIKDIKNPQSDVNFANQELTDLNSEYMGLTEKKFKILNEQKYNYSLFEILKDSGIKTKIISEYLPIINTMINKYLNILDFFVSFHLDETFSETIRSRYRDEFSYSSFSEGEKQRIDLSILFTWRQIARMKNSVSTNLLIMDEIMDASIDADGLENLQQILNTLDEETNVFIISHRQELKDKSLFDQVIGFKKVKNFSEKYVENPLTK